MRHFNAYIIAIAMLMTCTSSAYSAPRFKNHRAPKLSIYLTVADGFSCSDLSLLSTDASIEGSIPLAYMTYRRGMYSATLEHSAGSYEIGGELSCDSGRYALSSFSVTLTPGKTVKQTLEVDFSAPIVDPEPEPEPEPSCDSDEWVRSISNLDLDLDEAHLLLQDARYYSVTGEAELVSERLVTLEGHLAAMEASVDDITVDGNAVYTCQFYACPEAPEVAEVTDFELPVLTMDNIGLSGVDPSDQVSMISQIDDAIEAVSIVRAQIFSEFRVLNTATFYQCSFNVELTQLLDRQAELAQLASSPSSTDLDRQSLQLEYARTSLEISRIASAAGCDSSSVNGCDADGSCPSIATEALALIAIEDVEAARAESEVCAPWS